MIIHAGFHYCLMAHVVPQINNVNSASNLRAMNANRRSFNDTRVMWVFGRLTSVRPLCTRTRTTGRGWIWPAGGCSLQPGRELRQREEGLSLRPLASTWAQASAESQRRERARDVTGKVSLPSLADSRLCMTKCFLSALGRVPHGAAEPRVRPFENISGAAKAGYCSFFKFFF